MSLFVFVEQEMTFFGTGLNKHDFLINVCIFLFISTDRSIVILGIVK
jgi:hypothetical protein